MAITPNFLIIGSQKAGTTSLYYVLKQHPEIYMPEKKEINFFFRENEYRRGPQEYFKYFVEGADYPARGEASPGYICHPDAPRRIYSLIPNVKLILTVREPIRRALSQYWDNRRHLREPYDWETCVRLYLSDRYIPGKVGYFSRGVYIRYIRNFLKYFPKERLLVLVFEDLVNNPYKFYRTIFEFLNVDPDFYTDHMLKSFNPMEIWNNPFYRILLKKSYLQKYVPKKLRRLFFFGKKISFSPPPIHRDVKNFLEDFYRPWNNELRKFLKHDLPGWA